MKRFFLNELFAFRRTPALKEHTSRLGPLVSRAERSYDSLHVYNRLHTVRVALCPGESERRSPVMDDQNDVASQSDSIKPRIQIPLMVKEAIMAILGGTGIAHPDIVGRKTTAERH